MKLKFNIYTSHLLFVAASYFLAMISHFMLEKYWSGLTDILVIGIWYWNYTITSKCVELCKKNGKEYGGITLMKTICIFVLILNAIVLSAGPLSILALFVFAAAFFEAYVLLRYHGVFSKISNWLKR